MELKRNIKVGDNLKDKIIYIDVNALMEVGTFTTQGQNAIITFSDGWGIYQNVADDYVLIDYYNPNTGESEDLVTYTNGAWYSLNNFNWKYNIYDSNGEVSTVNEVIEGYTVFKIITDVYAYCDMNCEYPTYSREEINDLIKIKSSKITSGTSDVDSSYGEDGDIYLKYE